MFWILSFFERVLASSQEEELGDSKGQKCDLHFFSGAELVVNGEENKE